MRILPWDTLLTLKLTRWQPLNVPTILAASSFVGLGVITSDVYVSDTEEWYAARLAP